MLCPAHLKFGPHTSEMSSSPGLRKKHGEKSQISPHNENIRWDYLHPTNTSENSGRLEWNRYNNLSSIFCSTNTSRILWFPSKLYSFLHHFPRETISLFGIKWDKIIAPLTYNVLSLCCYFITWKQKKKLSFTQPVTTIMNPLPWFEDLIVLS